MESIKSQRWAFTAYEQDWDCFRVMPEIVAEWGYQEEMCPTTGRKHYQGYMRLKRQARLAQLKKIFPTTHFEIAKNWDALVNYCKKEETRVDGGQQRHEVSTRYLSMSDALIKVAAVAERIDISRYDDEDRKRRAIVNEYDVAVAVLLRTDANLIGIYSQPQYERAYVKWRQVWIEYADRQTDRQTQNEDAQVQNEVESENEDYDRS